MNVSFTQEQFNLVRDLLHKHYDKISTDWAPSNDDAVMSTYSAIIAMRIPIAEKAWKEYCQQHPDPDWRVYSTKEEFFKDQYTIYPEDLKK